MDLKQQLDATIGQPPVSSIDIDATVTKMRRRMWTVRGTAATATVGVLTAGAMLAWPMLVGTQPPSSNPPPQTQAVLPAAPKPESEQDIANRLTIAVQAKLHALLPGATLIPNWAGHDAAVVYPERPAMVPDSYPWNSMRAQADVRDPKGTGFVDVMIGRMTADPNARNYCLTAEDVKRSPMPPSIDLSQCGMFAQMGYPLGGYDSCAEYDQVLDGEDECTEQTTAAGDHVVMLRGKHEFRVDVARADGTAVIVMSGSRAYGGGTRPTPSLTIDQMVSLATDPTLAL
jgi:hypothetical protein